MLIAVVAMTSCQKDETFATSDAGMVDVSITTQLDQGNAATRSGDVVRGDGSTVNRAILEVYLADGELYKRMVTNVTNMTANFELRLVSSQTYEFIAWADYVDDVSTDVHYNTNSGLKAISMMGDYVGNDETRDAFFDSQTMTINQATQLNLELKRPFGQLNVNTTLTDVPAYLRPDAVKVSYATELYTVFNALTGDVSKLEKIEWSASANVVEGIDVDATTLDLSTDYIFAPNGEDQKYLIDFKMEFYESGTLITSNDNFCNIPIQRNYQTNVYGELLTEQGAINSTVNAEFEDNNSTPVIGLSIDSADESKELLVGDTYTFPIVVTPEEELCNIRWSSNKVDVATVDELSGVVVAVSEGTATITATLGDQSITMSAIVKIAPATSTAPGLDGSDYIVIYLDTETAAELEGRVKYDYSIQTNEHISMAIWGDTYSLLSPSGTNAYGKSADYYNLKVLSIGWSAMAIGMSDNDQIKTLSEITKSPDEYYLHFAAKSTVEDASHLIRVWGTDGGNGDYILGSGSLEGVTTPASPAILADGEWHHYDIPVSALVATGLSFDENTTSTELNIFSAYSGGVTDTGLSLDAIFFYKKTE